MELHAMARDLEAAAQVEWSWPRGGSDTNTRNALESVADISYALDDGAVLDIIRELDSWARKSKIALGDAEGFRRIPRSPGQREQACPWCGYLTLRYLPLRGVVRCVNPVCRDVDGVRPSAVVGITDDGPSLTWHDGTSGFSQPSDGEAHCDHEVA